MSQVVSQASLNFMHEYPSYLPAHISKTASQPCIQFDKGALVFILLTGPYCSLEKLFILVPSDVSLQHFPVFNTININSKDTVRKNIIDVLCISELYRLD
jgi:hypothetical protein